MIVNKIRDNKFLLFLTLLILQFSFLIIILYIKDFTGLSIIFDDKSLEDDLVDNFIPMAIFFSIIFPIYEEVSDRLYLSLEPNHIVLSIFATAFSFVLIKSGFIFLYVLVSIYLCFLILLLVNHFNSFKQPSTFWLGFISVIFFAVFHLNSYDPQEIMNYWYFIPLMISSQLLLGVFCVIIRLKMGFWQAVLFHSVYNFVLLSVIKFDL